MPHNEHHDDAHWIPYFLKLWPDYWSEDERGEFAAWFSLNPEAGDVVTASGGVRKVRWTTKGKGKRGGVRIIGAEAGKATFEIPSP